jgi:protein-L-isoaspartate O-methyltransferase
MADDEGTIASLSTAVRCRPDRARGLLAVANFALHKKKYSRAVELVREAMALSLPSSEAYQLGRQMLGARIPGYHIPMMNDARRNAAWDKALRNAIRPGMHVLEIGTGAGMLALMAARAGAEKVITCEKDEVVAGLARELAACNGYADRIVVITKRSQDIKLGSDLERPADLLFCDLFADKFFDFDPLSAISDARQRLLAPGAPAIPAAGALRLALANHSDYSRGFEATHAAGFDIRPVASFARFGCSQDIGSPNLQLKSESVESFRFDFAAATQLPCDRRELCLEAAADCEVNGLVQWIRLELDKDTALEARPEPGEAFFSSPVFYASPQSLMLSKGDHVRVAASYNKTNVMNWIVG